MGYCTTYNLSLCTPDGKSFIEDSAVHDKVVTLLKERGAINYALDENLDCYDPVKWCEHDNDMLEISKQVPNILFRLHGEGDESEDIWDCYYLNGKTQYCKAEITIPPYDPNKLE